LSAVDTRRSSLVAGHETSASRASEAPSARQVVQAYVALCKPRIIELLLITAVPVLFLADRGLPSLLDAAVVVLGGALAAGSANAP
jgi:protoheme IX farnesyltransferase